MTILAGIPTTDSRPEQTQMESSRWLMEVDSFCGQVTDIDVPIVIHPTNNIPLAGWSPSTICAGLALFDLTARMTSRLSRRPSRAVRLRRAAAVWAVLDSLQPVCKQKVRLYDYGFVACK